MTLDVHTLSQWKTIQLRQTPVTSAPMLALRQEAKHTACKHRLQGAIQTNEARTCPDDSSFSDGTTDPLNNIVCKSYLRMKGLIS